VVYGFRTRGLEHFDTLQPSHCNVVIVTNSTVDLDGGEYGFDGRSQRYAKRAARQRKQQRHVARYNGRDWNFAQAARHEPILPERYSVGW
jgi:hypothetical protein